MVHAQASFPATHIIFTLGFLRRHADMDFTESHISVNGQEDFAHAMYILGLL